ncbi:MAG: hypothetical protein DDT26_02457 [Dehalococcoidia bacterium]|nr:hypothetical protein [Chloroflexota bacterium]
MHELYSFHFLDTISAQLHAQLEAMEQTELTEHTLTALAAFQHENNAAQGVYVLHHLGVPVYVGKASNMKYRLKKHLKKISGRKNISVRDTTYKALLLDKSMSTAANETILLGLFQESHAGMWNNGGFGPNDPGKERDTTEPGDFDRAHPIQERWLITLRESQATIGEVLASMKKQLPYVFRYQSLSAMERSIPIDPSTSPADADALFEACVRKLGVGWKGAILSYGMVLYRNSKSYPFGREVLP